MKNNNNKLIKMESNLPPVGDILPNETTMANPIKDTLPQYVDENRFELISKSVFGGRTASIINYNTGVKGTATLNILETEVALQDGATCGFTAQGTQEITQRPLVTYPYKVNMEYCEKNFLNTFAQYLVKVNAVDNALPYEEKFIADVIKSVNNKIETMLWKGDEKDSFGILPILEAEENVIKVSGAKSDVFGALQSTLLALPTSAIAEDTRFFVGDDTFMKLVTELVNKNLYHYSGENSNYEIVLPGTSIRVTAVNGLNGTNKIVAGKASNFYMGVDMEGDQERFDFWFSQDDRTFKLAIEFNLGTQIAFPDEVVVTTLA